MSLNENEQPEYVKTEAVENVDGVTIVKMAQETIIPGATISTDGLAVYNALNAAGYEQQGEKFDPVNNPRHLHWLHVIISNLKSFIAGTYHGLDKKHLQSYFDEFCWRFNRRKFGNQLFNRLLQACASTTSITYTKLVGIESH